MPVPAPYRSLDRLHPQLRYRANEFLALLERENLSIIITETWRSKERQEYLYSLGRTRPGQKVTWTMESKHLLGEAFDVAFLNHGKVTYEGDWEKLGFLGEQVGMLWGGRWTGTPDKPHFELNHAWQSDHWAFESEKKVMDAGLVQYKKDLTKPLSRGEFYVILQKLHNL